MPVQYPLVCGGVDYPTQVPTPTPVTLETPLIHIRTVTEANYIQTLKSAEATRQSQKKVSEVKELLAWVMRLPHAFHELPASVDLNEIVRLHDPNEFDSEDLVLMLSTRNLLLNAVRQSQQTVGFFLLDGGQPLLVQNEDYTCSLMATETLAHNLCPLVVALLHKEDWAHYALAARILKMPWKH